MSKTRNFLQYQVAEEHAKKLHSIADKWEVTQEVEKELTDETKWKIDTFSYTQYGKNQEKITKKQPTKQTPPMHTHYSGTKSLRQ